jgi:hypothetical protein
MRLMLMAGLTLLGLAAMPGDAGAQAAGVVTIAPSPGTLSAAARLRLPAGHPLPLVPPVGELMTQGSRSNRRQGEILMIVGAAGIVTGLLVDEDLVTIAGAAVGGFGLYLYLQATR